MNIKYISLLSLFCSVAAVNASSRLEKLEQARNNFQSCHGLSVCKPQREALEEAMDDFLEPHEKARVEAIHESYKYNNGIRMEMLPFVGNSIRKHRLQSVSKSLCHKWFIEGFKRKYPREYNQSTEDFSLHLLDRECHAGRIHYMYGNVYMNEARAEVKQMIEDQAQKSE